MYKLFEKILVNITKEEFESNQNTNKVFKNTVSAVSGSIDNSNIKILNINNDVIKISANNYVIKTKKFNQNIFSFLSPQKNAVELNATTVTLKQILINYNIMLTIEYFQNFKNSSQAYSTLKNNLNTSVYNGDFIKTLHKFAKDLNISVLSNVYKTQATFSTSTVDEIVAPTTASGNTDNNNNANDFKNWPLYGQVLLPIGCVIIFLISSSLFFFIVKNRKTDDNMNNNTHNNNNNNNNNNNMNNKHASNKSSSSIVARSKSLKNPNNKTERLLNKLFYNFFFIIL
jgi:hypothetical protein